MQNFKQVWLSSMPQQLCTHVHCSQKWQTKRRTFDSLLLLIKENSRQPTLTKPVNWRQKYLWNSSFCREKHNYGCSKFWRPVSTCVWVCVCVCGPTVVHITSAQTHTFTTITTTTIIFIIPIFVSLSLMLMKVDGKTQKSGQCDAVEERNTSCVLCSDLTLTLTHTHILELWFN